MNRLLLTLALGWVLCGQTQAQTQSLSFNHLPPDADRVYHINVPVLFKDISWTQLLSAFPVPSTSDRQFLAEIIGFMKESGIDTTREILIATTNQSHQDSFRYTTIIFHLADSGKYIRYLHSKIKPLRPQPIRGTHAEGSMNYGTAFTNNLAIFIEAHPPTFENPAAKKIPSSEWQMVNASRATAALKGFDRSFYTTNANFLSDFNDGAPMHFYSRHGDNMAIAHGILQAIGQRGEVFAMINALSHSAPTTGTLTITAGKLTYTTRQSAGAGENGADKPSNEKLLAAIPAGTRLMCMASVRIDIGIQLAMAGKQGKVHDAYTRLDFDSSIYRRAFDDHLLVVCLDPDKAMIAATGSQAPVFIGIASIGDQTTYDNIATRLDAVHVAHTEKDGLAFFGKSRDLLQAFTSDARKDNPTLAQDAFLAAPAAFTFNPPVMLDVFSHATPADDKAAANINAVMNLWRPFVDLTFATGQTENGRRITSIQLTLSDRSKNPLHALLQLAKAGLSLPGGQ